jgi:hypothetical protein
VILLSSPPPTPKAGPMSCGWCRGMRVRRPVERRYSPPSPSSTSRQRDDASRGACGLGQGRGTGGLVVEACGYHMAV